MSDKPLIRVERVNQIFTSGKASQQVIKDATFNIEKNSFNIIYGPSGSGKSTLLNILAGLQKPVSGTIEMDGQNFYKLENDELAYYRARHVGIVYQSNHWVGSLTVLENVAMPLVFSGHSWLSAKKIAKTSLQRVGMLEHANKNPLLLSGGEQQRVSMARAIVNTPLFIIADEPTGNLDTANGDKIIELLQEYKEQFKCTIILVTHNLEYLPLGDSVLYLNNGVVTQKKEIDGARAANILLRDLAHRIDSIKRMKK